MIPKQPPILAVACAALLVADCGGGASSGPSTGPSASTVPTPTPTPTPLPPPAAFHGVTHAEVGAEFTPSDPDPGDALTIRSPGLIVREQPYDGSPIFLWPADEGYLDELVHGWRFTDGSFRMVRWASSFTLTLDGELDEVPAVVDKAREVIDEINGLTGLEIRLGPGGPCVVRVDRDIRGEGAIGRVRLSFRGPDVIGADITFGTRQEITGGGGSDFRNTLLHEMGHAMGLRHSNNVRDVMTPSVGPGTKVDRFQEHEAAALHMMYAHRRAGNRAPDRDPAVVGGAAAIPWTVVIDD